MVKIMDLCNSFKEPFCLNIGYGRFEFFFSQSPDA